MSAGDWPMERRAVRSIIATTTSLCGSETHLSHLHATRIKPPSKLADDAHAVGLSRGNLCPEQSGHIYLHSFKQYDKSSSYG
jgi:hypothetical protein